MPPKARTTSSSSDAAVLSALEKIAIPSDPLPNAKASAATKATQKPAARATSRSRAASETAKKNAEHTREIKKRRQERDLYRAQRRGDRQRQCVIMLACIIISFVAMWGTKYALRKPGTQKGAN